jgi:UDP-glucuronate decarboxylase
VKILITGGAGFIGANLAEKLLEGGHEVHCWDNFFSSSRNNLSHLEGRPGFFVQERDIIGGALPHDVTFDRIYNLACPASPAWYQKDPIMVIRANTEGLMNVLELARTTGARVLQASTSEIYGDPLENPQKETYRGNVNTLGPRACYDEGKRIAETILMEYHRLYGVDIRIARIFNTYGPRMSAEDGRVVSNFILQALRNEPITIYGDGTQTRSFQYISDLMAGLMALMEAPDIIGPFNIGNPEEFTMKELAETVLRLTESESKVTYRPLPEDDPRQRKPDITRAVEAFGWRPGVKLEEGLQNTIAYFRQGEASRN